MSDYRTPALITRNKADRPKPRETTLLVELRETDRFVEFKEGLSAATMAFLIVTLSYKVAGVIMGILLKL